MQAAGKALNLRAVDAGERAEVALVAQTTGVQIHEVALAEQAQVALGVGQQRAQAAGADAVDDIQPALGKEVLRQLNQDEILIVCRRS